ncbi:tumor necrosis factor receptor superfamily member 1B [Engraulis encrasicolus]|uniref:tumor necrosis factor receptor superfamily member 1B n=1 Tax=Engraulis encrasicolus TaxID=184585 RepID=UPI002FD28CAA
MTSQIAWLIFLTISLLFSGEGFGESCNNNTHYYDEEQNTCCKKCEPGTHLETGCTISSDTVCAECRSGYHTGRNYHENCFRCSKCQADRGLRYAQNCSKTQNAKCVCQTGMFCIKGYEAPYCKECNKYKTCPPGKEIIRTGTENSDVVCGAAEERAKLPAQEPTTTTTTTTITPRPATTHIPTTSSATVPLNPAAQSTSQVLTSISHAAPSTGTVALIVVGCVVGLLVVVGSMFVMFQRRQTTGSSEIKVQIENGCAEAATCTSPTESDCPLLKLNGVSDQSATSPSPG